MSLTTRTRARHLVRTMLDLASRWLIAALMCLGMGLPAIACEIPPDMRTDLPPGGANEATEVTASFSVVDFMGVDDENQRIEIDFFMRMYWTDPRLADSAGCRFGVTEVWFPRIRLLNSDQLRVAYRNARNQVAVGPGGRVEYTQRFTGAVSSYHNLSRFPFDSHQFSIDFVNVEEPNNLVDFVPDQENTWIADRLNIEGWTVGDARLETGALTFRRTELELEMISLIIDAKRNPQFYIYRLISLLTLVVAMSWVIFWVPPSQFEFQIGIGATTMLTAMAFIFAISSQLPPVGYLTTLDKLVIWAIVLIFLSIVEALVAGRMVLAGREQLALKLDRASRFVFPALLVGGWALAISGWNG
ncbi:MAG: hypothetical protein AB3N23_07690 [Paracoccaceae bacterium]